MTDSSPMPLTIVLRSSPWRWLRLTALSVAFTLVGWLMIASGDRAGWFPVIFFGLCALVGLASLALRGRLELTPQGLSMVHLGRRHPALDWRHLSGFHVWSPTPGAKFVAFNYSGPGRMWTGRAARLARSIAGGNGSLPDTYGMRAEDLCRLLADWAAQRRHK